MAEVTRRPCRREGCPGVEVHDEGLGLRYDGCGHPTINALSVPPCPFLGRGGELVRAWERPVVIEWHATPPSLNRSNHRKAHWRWSRAKADWEKVLALLLLECGSHFPRGDVAFVHADAILRFPIARRRDEGNFRALLEKALGDALQIHWLEDDTGEHFRFGSLFFEPDRGPARTRIRLAWERRS